MSEKATPQAPRPRFGSIVDRETSRLTQLLVDSHTTILRGLSMLAPKHRRSRVRWILAAGFLTVIGVLGAGRSTREFATSKARDFYRAHSASEAPPPTAPTVEPAPAATANSVAWPSAAPVQVPAAVVAVEAAEATPPKEQASPAAVSSTGSRSTRAPKARGANRPRVSSSQGGT